LFFPDGEQDLRTARNGHVSGGGHCLKNYTYPPTTGKGSMMKYPRPSTSCCWFSSAFVFFCGLALGKPDASLLASDARVTLPFANADISFVAFLFIAPLVLTALSFYLHIFVGYWINLSRQIPASSSMEQTHPVLPFVFNLPYRTADWLSVFLFYWLVPIMLGVFAWKALPRPEAPRLIALTSAFVVVFLFLQLRRRYDQTLPIITFIKWLMFLSGVFIAVLAFY
jgi:hypothetical protein